MRSGRVVGKLGEKRLGFFQFGVVFVGVHG